MPQLGFRDVFWPTLGIVCISFHVWLIFAGLVPNLVSRPIHMALALPWVLLWRPKGQQADALSWLVCFSRANRLRLGRPATEPTLRSIRQSRRALANAACDCFGVIGHRYGPSRSGLAPTLDRGLDVALRLVWKLHPWRVWPRRHATD